MDQGHQASLQRFSSVKISTRLTLGFSALVLLLILLTAIGIYQVNKIDRDLTTINDVNGTKQQYAVDMRGSVHDRAIVLRDIVLRDSVLRADANRIAPLVDEFEALSSDYATAVEGEHAVSREYTGTDREQAILASIDSQEREAIALTQQLLAASQAGDTDRARALMLDEVGPAYAEWLKRINQFIDLQDSLNDTTTASAQASASGFQMLMLGLTLLAVLLGGAIVFWLSRQLLKELGAEPHEVKAFAQAIGRGELATQGRVKSGDQHSIMASQIAMAKQLQDIVIQVRASAEAVASNSEQIAEGNTDLSSRTEEQASALAETAAAMDQLNSSVKLNADNSAQASSEAVSASQIATQGGESVNQVVATMHELNENSEEIAGITATIDSIAFQTNILALNASVEAARAGEHGRGFAVVAEEVRNLAQRSANAAKEISELVANNQGRVAHGNERAKAAERSTADIVSAIERVTQIMQEISHASAEQSTGVQEAGQAITEMDQVTQQNAALVEQSASAADNLRNNARQLLRSMEVFTLPGAAQNVPISRAANAQPAFDAPVAHKASTSTAPATQTRGSSAASQAGSEPEWESF